MEIVISGSIAFDYLMRFPGHFTDHLIPEKLDRVSLSFLVDHLDKHFGGVAPNIAYTLALLGERPKVLGTVGKDFDKYRAWLETTGVDTSAIVQLDDVFRLFLRQHRPRQQPDRELLCRSDGARARLHACQYARPHA